MSFRINTNVNALNTHANAVSNNVDLSKSLGKLSSGLRIQTAADDASGLSIADSLRSQASALGQAIANGNDAIGIIQVADKAMDEQLKVLDTIKMKATQSAQDGQTTQSRQALQADIVRLMEELDNIGNTTSFNGQQLLNGTFSNKEFQIGAYSNQTVKASIGATTSDKIGLTRFESSKLLTKTAAGAISLTFVNVDGVNNVKVQAATISTGLGKGVGALAENINKVSNETGVRATYDVKWIGKTAIAAGEIKDLKINGVIIGDISVKANDENGALINAINAVKDQTGVTASLDKGKLVLTSDGRAIQATSTKDAAKAANNMSTIFGYATKGEDLEKMGAALSGMFIGRLNLVKLDGRDIKISTGGAGNTLGALSIAFSAGKAGSNGGAQASVSLREIKGQIDKTLAAAMGFTRMNNSGAMTSNQSAGVMTLTGAMAVMNIAESAQKTLDQIRSDLGSVQNQLQATVNNITVTQVNVKSAESQIRDVDFASESANFSKHNILAQSGAYAMSQANSVQQNVMKLLQ